MFTDSPEVVPSRWKQRGSSGGERKSARLTMSSEDTMAAMLEEPISKHKQPDIKMDSNVLNQQNEE